MPLPRAKPAHVGDCVLVAARGRVLAGCEHTGTQLGIGVWGLHRRRGGDTQPPRPVVQTGNGAKDGETALREPP